ncbi:MAG: hypothetical protein VSS75_031220 [Candidatus Parabeggiatoa sp.]|nr:hypothetical protein [Candidatus Parabeggiatoa sp.]
MATEITGAQFNRNVSLARLEAFRSWLNWTIAAIEAYGWFSFGIGFAQYGFAVWAILMVLMRSHLSEIKVLAFKHSNIRLANQAAGMIALSVAITAFSLYTVYSDEMHKANQYRIAQSIPVKLADSKLKSLEDELQKLESESEATQIASARSEYQSLQKRLKQAQQPIQRFWQNKHRNGELYDDIVDQNTLSAKASQWGGGLMTTARNEIVAQWNALQSNVQTIEYKIGQLKSILMAGQKIESLHGQINTARTKLLQAQTQSGISLNETHTHHPVFHLLSELTFDTISPNTIMSLFGIAAILLVLITNNVMSEAIAIAPNVPNPSISDNKPIKTWSTKLVELISEKIKSPRPIETNPSPITAVYSPTQPSSPQMTNERSDKPTTTVLIDESDNRQGFIGFIPPSTPKREQVAKTGRKDFDIERYNTVTALLEKGHSVPQITKLTGIPRSTAYLDKKRWENSPKPIKPMSNQRTSD